MWFVHRHSVVSKAQVIVYQPVNFALLMVLWDTGKIFFFLNGFLGTENFRYGLCWLCYSLWFILPRAAKDTLSATLHAAKLGRFSFFSEFSWIELE